MRVKREWKHSEWERKNPVLARGEAGLELNTNRLKVGDGETPWNDLPYVEGGTDNSAGIAIAMTLVL